MIERVDVKVIFRKDRDGVVFAILPEDPERDGSVTTYDIVGQHSSGNYAGMIRHSVPARPDEYADIKREMEGQGYDITVIQRRPVCVRRVTS